MYKETGIIKINIVQHNILLYINILKEKHSGIIISNI